MATSLEKLDIVGKAEAFISVKGSICTADRARACDPPGCVTLARAQGIGGNLGDPRVSTNAGRHADRKEGAGRALEAAGTKSATVAADLAGNKAMGVCVIELSEVVGTSEGDRSEFQRAGGVGFANSTREAGEGAKAPTPWREGADRGSRKGTVNSGSSEGNIHSTRRLQ